MNAEQAKYFPAPPPSFTPQALPRMRLYRLPRSEAGALTFDAIVLGAPSVVPPATSRPGAAQPPEQTAPSPTDAPALGSSMTNYIPPAAKPEPKKDAPVWPWVLGGAGLLGVVGIGVWASTRRTRPRRRRR